MYINLVQGDTGIGRRVTLENENGAVDLTDADVLFLFDEHEIHPIKEEQKGKLKLVFEEVHTRKARMFTAVFKVKFKDGRKETFPGVGEKIYVRVKGDGVNG